MKQKCLDILRDRVIGVQNDLKAFIYIRKHSLQHKDDNIGGGNIVTALSLFTALNLLSKAYYCCKRPDKFGADGRPENETECFIHLMKYIQQQGIDLGLTSNGENLELVWHGFRDHLAHLLVPEPGKSVLTFEFPAEEGRTIAEILDKAKTHPVFEHDGDHRNWTVNCDALLANLPAMVDIVCDFVERSEVDEELLKKVVGVE